MNPRILLFPADETGCGNQRIIWPAAILEARGYDVTVVPPKAEQLKVVLRTGDDGKEHVVSAGVPATDLVVFQRPLSRLVAEALILLSDTIPVVVELDDNFAVLPQQNAAWRHTHPRLSPDANWHHLDRVIAHAAHLVVTSHALQGRYGTKIPTTIVPNYIPDDYLEYERPDHPGVIIGWPGNAAVHPGDLDVARPAIDAVTKTDGVEFYILGPGDTPNCTGWLTGDCYPKAISELDIGIAPLADNAFNRSKSFLKPLELAALGVPFVASDRAEYQWLAHWHGIGDGWLARNPKEWRAMLTRLAADPDLRTETADRHRNLIRTHRLTLQDRAEQFHWAWTAPLR